MGGQHREGECRIGRQIPVAVRHAVGGQRVLVVALGVGRAHVPVHDEGVDRDRDGGQLRRGAHRRIGRGRRRYRRIAGDRMKLQHG